MNENDVQKRISESDSQVLDRLLELWSNANRLDIAEAASMMKILQRTTKQETLTLDWWQHCLSVGLDRLCVVSKKEWIAWTRPTFATIRQSFN